MEDNVSTLVNSNDNTDSHAFKITLNGKVHTSKQLCLPAQSFRNIHWSTCNIANYMISYITHSCTNIRIHL